MARFECLSAPVPRRVARGAFGVCVTFLIAACTEAVQIGENFGAGGALTTAGASGAGLGGSNIFFDGGASGPGAAGGGASGGGATAECVPVACGQIQQCGDCLDNDMDGLADASDPDCLGPCDNREDALFAGTSVRVNGTCDTDCYFDRNAGAGNDGCRWSYRCDPLAVAPDFPPTGLERCSNVSSGDADCVMNESEQALCEAGCLPFTPNGCDCFGCCELPAGSDRFVWLGSENTDLGFCELATSADPALCRPCTPVPTCQNTCLECELCVGKTELPASCNDGTGTVGSPVCPAGRRSCDPARGVECGALEYCITGCCVPAPR